MFNAKFNHEARFFADGYELSGVENVSFAYNASQSLLKPLGTKDGLTTHSGPVNQTMSLSRVVTYSDPLVSFTGEDPLSGSIYYNDGKTEFKSGYLSDYSINCAVGSVPRSTCNFQIVDEIITSNDQPSVYSPPTAKEHPDIDIPTQGSISITCKNATTNRVIGFDYAVKCDRKAYLTIGSDKIKSVELLPPVQYTATVQIDVDDAFLSNSRSFLENKEDKNVSITINGRQGDLLATYVLPKASLVGENLQVSADGGAKLTLNYVGHSAKEEPEALSSNITYLFKQDGSIYDYTSDRSISYEYYKEDDNIYGLQLSNDVTGISGRAFQDCSNLGGDLYINMDALSDGQYSTIDYGAFQRCSGFDGSLIIEDGLQKIGDSAFANTRFRGNLVFPDSIKIIGANAFYNCIGFNGLLQLPNSEFTLGQSAFESASKLKGDITIPDGLQGGIEKRTFWTCSGFDGNLSIGTGVTYIGEQAFVRCSSLKGGVVMPPNLTRIEKDAFWKCTSLDGELILNDGLEYIGKGAFQYNSQAKGLVIPDSVTGIDDYAFRYCSGFKSLTIGEGLQRIGENAFANCTRIAGDIDFKNVKIIENKAFINSSDIGSLTFGPIEKIGDEAFRYCESLNGDITLPDSLTYLGGYAFEDTRVTNGSLTIGNSLTGIPIKAFHKTFFDGSLTLGQNIKTIKDRAFKEAGFTNQLVLPDSVERIEYGAFYADNFTGDLVLHSGIKFIDALAFEECRSIKRVIVDIPPTLFNGGNQFRNVGADVGGGTLHANERDYYDYYNSNPNNRQFKGIPVKRGALQSRVYNASDDSIIKSLDSDIPSSWYDSTDSTNEGNPYVYLDIGFTASKIADNAFLYNTYITGNLFIPGNVTGIGNSSFKGCSNISGNLYLEEGIKEIGNECFRHCSGFGGNLTLPNSIDSIGEFCFQDMRRLDGSLTLGSGIREIERYTFDRCASLTGSISFPSGLTGVGVGAFRDCSGFSSLHLNEDLVEIQNTAFQRCFNISNPITIPINTKRIGNNSFARCANIPSVDFGNNLESIGSQAFANCSGLSSITLRNNITGVGDAAFRFCPNIQYAYIDVPTGAIGNSNTLRFVDNENTSDRILFVSEQYYTDYLNASTQALGGGFQGYFQGNLISIWPEDERTTFYYDQDFNVVDSVLGDTEDSWKLNDLNGHYVYIGSKTETINKWSFANSTINTSLLSGTLLLPSTLKTIKDGGFQRARFTSVASQEGLNVMEQNAFSECRDLKTLVLPASLESVGYRAGYQLVNINKIQIGNNISEPKTILANEAFYLAGTLSASNNEAGELFLGRSVQEVGTYCFANDASGPDEDWITELDLNAKKVLDYAFSRQSRITDLTISTYCHDIGKRVFESCSGLTDVVASGNIDIDEYAFNNTPNITNVEIGTYDGTEYFGKLVKGQIKQHAFNGAGKTNGQGFVKIGDQIDTIGYRSFYSTNTWFTGADLNCKRVGQEALGNNNKLTKVTFGSGVRYIERNALVGSEITEIRIPDPFRLYNTAFGSITGVTGVYIGNDTKNRTSTYLEDHCFNNMGYSGNSVGHLYIGSSIDTVSDLAFYVWGLGNPGGRNDAAQWIKTADLRCRKLEGARNADWGTFRYQAKMTSVNFADTVKYIGYRAFNYCYGLTGRLHIPDPEYIASQAFHACEKVTGVRVGNNQRNTQGELADSAFRWMGYYYRNDPAVGDVWVGSSIKTVGDHAFYGDTNHKWIKNVTLNCEEVKYKAFAYQPNIESITFGSNLKYLGNRTFHSNYGLTGIHIPNLTGIDEYCFYDCTGISGIVVGNDDEENTNYKILPKAFEGVGYGIDINNLDAFIDVRSSIDSVGTRAFNGYYGGAEYGRKNITHARFNCRQIGEHAVQHQNRLRELELTERVKRIETRAFNGGTSLTGVRIPDPEYIAAYAFDDNFTITGLWIGNNTEDTQGELATNSFRNIGNKTNALNGNGYVFIGSSIRKIGDNSFYGEDGALGNRMWITKADIYAKEIGKRAFYNQDYLTGIYIDENVDSVGDEAFWGVANQPGPQGQLTGIRIPDPTYVGKLCFKNCGYLSGAYIGNDTKDTKGIIATTAFQELGSNVLGLGHVYVGSSIDEIGESAFYGNHNWIKSAELNCRKIGKYAFRGQANMTGVTFGEGVKDIGEQAFWADNSIPIIRVHDPKHIHFKAFDNMDMLTGVYIGNDTENTSGIIYAEAFTHMGSAATEGLGHVYIGSSIDRVSSDSTFWANNKSNWIKSVDIRCRVLGDDVTPGGKANWGVFRDQRKLEHVTLSSGVKIIGRCTFNNEGTLTSHSLTGLRIPDPEYIGSATTRFNHALTGLYIGNDENDPHTYISKDAFYACGRDNAGANAKGYLYVGRSVDYIGERAFCGGGYNGEYYGTSPHYGWAWIKKADIKAREIGPQAFWMQRRMEELNISDDVKIIRHDAFNRMTSIKELRIPDPERLEYLGYALNDLTGVFLGNNEKDTKGETFITSIDGTNYYGAGYFLGKTASSTSDNVPYYMTPGQVHLFIGSSIDVIGDRAFRAGRRWTNEWDDYRKYQWLGSLEVHSRSIGDIYNDRLGLDYTKGAFALQKALTGVKFGDTVKIIGSGAFNYCDAITRLDIPDPDLIRTRAFRACRSISGVFIGNEEKDPHTILEDRSLDYIGEYKENQDGHLYLGRSVDTVGYLAFDGHWNTSWSRYGRSWIRTADIRARYLGKSSFSRQRYMTGVVLSEDVKHLGQYCFEYCTGLKEFTLPRFDFIDSWALSHCSNLEDVRLGVSEGTNGNAKIETDAFRYVGQNTQTLVNALTPSQFGGGHPGYVSLGRSISTCTTRAFYGDYNWINHVYLNCQNVGYDAFANQKNLKKLQIEWGVDKIFTRAFSGCSGLTGDLVCRGQEMRFGADAFVGCPVRDVYVRAFPQDVGGTNAYGQEGNPFPNMSGNFYVSQESKYIDSWPSTWYGRPVLPWPGTENGQYNTVR